jgi:hypothetical protein
MHDRLDHYTDHALTEHELRRLRWEAAAGPEFKTIMVRCINAEDAPPPLQAGGLYPAIGEVTENIDGRPLDKRDHRWILSVGEAAPQEFRKDRFMPEAEYLGWQVKRLQRQIASLAAELVALGVPRINSACYPEGFRWDIDNYPARQTRRWNPSTRTLEDGQDPPFEAPQHVPFEAL